MQGLHLTADLHGCAPAQPALTDAATLRACCLAAVGQAGLHAVADLFHRFEPAHDASPHAPVGVTGVVLLAESHLAVHTWPERGEVTLDVYVCNRGGDNSARAQALLDALVALFAPSAVERHELTRGTRPETGPALT